VADFGLGGHLSLSEPIENQKLLCPLIKQ
jgi:hypothetical protein